MMSGDTESEWLLERLCESLVRLERRKEMASDYDGVGGMRGKVMKVNSELPDVVEDEEEALARLPEQGKVQSR
jgi:hypothetical protein